MKIEIADSFYKSIDNMFSYKTRIKYFFRSIKNYILRPHTTIKPRYLGYGWCDKVEFLPHVMFESLSIFIENECSPGFVDWYYCPKMILVGMEWKNVRDEMQELYDWWHKEYIPYFNGETEPELEKETLSMDEFFEYLNKPKEYRTDKENKYEEYIGLCMKEEENMNRELNRRMNRLVRIREYLWT